MAVSPAQEAPEKKFKILGCCDDDIAKILDKKKQQSIVLASHFQIQVEMIVRLVMIFFMVGDIGYMIEENMSCRLLRCCFSDKTCGKTNKNNYLIHLNVYLR